MGWWGQGGGLWTALFNTSSDSVLSRAAFLILVLVITGGVVFVLVLVP